MCRLELGMSPIVLNQNPEFRHPEPAAYNSWLISANSDFALSQLSLARYISRFSPAAKSLWVELAMVKAIRSADGSCRNRNMPWRYIAFRNVDRWRWIQKYRRTSCTGCIAIERPAWVWSCKPGRQIHPGAGYSRTLPTPALPANLSNNSAK